MKNYPIIIRDTAKNYIHAIFGTRFWFCLKCYGLRLIRLSGLLIGVYPVMSASAQGQLDNSFNSQGYLNIDVPGIFDVVGGISERPDGKYIIASFSGEDAVSDDYIVISCIDSFGVQVQTFAENGNYVLTPSGGVHAVFQYILNNNDSVVVGWTSATGHTTAFVKLNSNGEPVDSFGDAGVLYLNTDLDDRYFHPEEIVEHSSNGFILVGTVFSDFTSSFHPGLLFLTESFVPDTNIGINGMIEFADLENHTVMSGCFNSEDELLLAGGFFINETTSNPFILKCDETGNPVNAFGTNGKVLFANNEYPENSVFSKIREYPTAGYSALLQSPSIYGITRIGEAGTFLPTFSTSGAYPGLFEFDEEVNGSYSDCLINQVDNKMLSVCPSNDNLLTLFKVTAPGNLDYAFGNNGIFQDGFETTGGALYPEIYLLNNEKILGGFTRGEDFTLTIFRLINEVGEPTIAVDELFDTPALSYPNPFNDYFAIAISLKCEIVVSTMQGEIIKHIDGAIGVNKIESSTWQSGIYVVRIIDQNNNHVVRMIKS